MLINKNNNRVVSIIYEKDGAEYVLNREYDIRIKSELVEEIEISDFPSEFDIRDCWCYDKNSGFYKCPELRTDE